MSARRGSIDLNDFLARLEGDPEYDAEQREIRPQTNLAINTHRLRTAAGMSQGELARAARMTQPAISKVERGDANLRLQTIARLAAALGVEASTLLADPPPAAPARVTAPSKEVVAPGSVSPRIIRREGVPTVRLDVAASDHFSLSA